MYIKITVTEILEKYLKHELSMIKQNNFLYTVLERNLVQEKVDLDDQLLVVC